MRMPPPSYLFGDANLTKNLSDMAYDIEEHFHIFFSVQYTVQNENKRKKNTKIGTVNVGRVTAGI